jgi:hypothetical protein
MESAGSLHPVIKYAQRLPFPRKFPAAMKRSLLLPLLFMLSTGLLAQTRQITGTVRSKSDKSPLLGVSVLLKGSSRGATTDGKGAFRIDVPTTNVVLVFSFIGYVTREVKVPTATGSLIVTLDEDVKALSEVVVIGYSTKEKRDITGAVAGRTAGVESRSRRAVPKSLPSPSASAMDREESGAPSEAARLADGAAEGPAGKPGVLTAGELNDYGKWGLWQDIATHDLQQWQQRWQISPLERYSVQLVNDAGFPVIDAVVRLRDGQGKTLWETRTDNTGKGELWQNLFAGGTAGKVASVEAVVNGQSYSLAGPTPFAAGVNTIKISQPCRTPAPVDIAFVVDATGSMGDEIEFLKAELSDVIGKAKTSLPGTTIRLGSVFYRDAGDEYVTRKNDFSPDIARTVNFIKAQRADGGGDFPEAVEEALQAAVHGLAWSPEARARLLFLVLDAPPHQNPEIIRALQRLTREAAAAGIRIIPVTASGIDKSTEYLMRSLALGTNGTYVFLTDDSGVGNPHIKPTTDKFEVELLNGLLTKLITRFTQTTDCRPVPVNAAGTAYAELPGTGSVPNGKRSWHYFPNPTREILNLTFGGEVKEFFVTDITGKIILRATPAGGKATVNLHNYPTGIYFVKVKQGEAWETGRFVLNR